MSTELIALVFLLIINVNGYNNGVGRLPIMGWSPCYTLNINTTEDYVKNQTIALINAGFYELGYQYINIDTGWILNRSSNGI